MSKTLQSWQQANWPQTAQRWTEAELSKQNIRLIDELQVVKTWALGHVLKQSTGSGDTFFKATAFLPLFSNEASLCAKLFELFPQYSARVIAFDAHQQWLLTESFGEAFVDTVPLCDWVKPFTEFANLQLASVDHIEELEAAGCIRRDITQLPTQLQRIFNDKAIISRLPQDIDLSTERLSQVLTKLKQSVTALAAYQLPSSLVHSDLHIENIAPRNGVKEHFTFFDWSDGCISHPFIDGTYLFRMDDSEGKQQIIDAYLNQWSKYGSKDELKRAWQLAESICYAHQAVSYAEMLHILSKQQTPDLIHAFENAFRRFLFKMMN